MRRLLKFLHTMGSAGFLGALASLLAIMAIGLPARDPESYVLTWRALSAVATWVFFPALAVTMIAGMIAFAWNRAFFSQGWAWAKLATGVLVFEGGLVGVQGPIKAEAERSAEALANHLAPSVIMAGGDVGVGPLWVMLVVATANVVLGVWRPRLGRRTAPEPDPAPVSGS
jgi:hypothetical protein